MGKREGEAGESSKTYSGVALNNAEQCCHSKVTVNGQHICCFA